MELLENQIAKYIGSFVPPESEILKELVRVSEKELEFTDMLSGPQVGALLRILILTSGARRVLEIGTFTGYSAITMADALPEDGTIITIEMNERYREISAPFFSKEPYKNKIIQKFGNALEVIPTLSGKFDLVFLDADKISYPTYYDLLKPKIKSGGLFIVDNVLWGGEVLRPQDEKSKAIHKLNKIIRDDKDVDQVMIPLRDGITIVRKS